MLAEMPTGLADWPLDIAKNRFSAAHHGDYPVWLRALQALPDLHTTAVHYDDTVCVDGDLARNCTTDVLKQSLQALHPWRKGPFRIGPVTINTEWRSDWKWARVAATLGDMRGQRVLDIGCGNGYFGWRMLAQGALKVVGIDPTLLFCMQHLAVQHYTQDMRNWVLPLKVEEIPGSVQFDTVFSMGVIYHRRDPQAHAQQLAALTAPGGRVVLESIVVDGSQSLMPSGRYARMRNVWCVPTVPAMCTWLRTAGYVDVTIIDVSPTTGDEQRSTDWMRFESLPEALDPVDPHKTVEGYPAPVRAMVSACKPG